MSMNYNHCPGGHEIYNFGKPLLNSLLSLRKTFVKKYIAFTFFIPNLPLIGVWGHGIYIFLSAYHNDAIHQIRFRLSQ